MEITNEIIQEIVPELKDMILQIERAHPVPSTVGRERSTQGKAS